MLEWAASQHARLVRELETADPEFPYFTWFRGDAPLTMWARRQAHETAVHRVDADLAAGWASTFAPAFAADGIDCRRCLRTDREPARRRAPSGDLTATARTLGADAQNVGVDTGNRTRTGAIWRG
ncbi:MAG: maleylpyruvate isomerase N-terminal domain-containing protein [Acidimicrobiales bacterium]